MTAPQTLVALLVREGRPNVAVSVQSAARLSGPGADVLVLDDAGTPRADHRTGEELSELCRSLGAGYYRSPRSLGPTRTMNLALQRGRTGGYEHVLVAGPDAVLPHNAVAGLVGTAGTDPSLAAVTAWSNDVSVYSLASLFFGAASGPRDLGHVRQDRVDWVSAVLQAEFGPSPTDVPFAVGGCSLVSMEAVAKVGLFDPALGALGALEAMGPAGIGRTGCEELDWGLRARAHGYRTVLAPGVFAYHAARPSSAEVLPAAPSPADRALDLRHPDGRSRAERLLDPGVLDELRVRAEAAVVREAARARGWCLEASRVARTPASDSVVQFVVATDGDRATARGRYLGATMDVALRRPSGVIGALHDLIGLPPSKVTIFDGGRHGDLLMAEAAGRGISVVDARSYPETL